MINVELNTNTGRSLLSLMIGLKVAVNQIKGRIMTEQLNNDKLLKDIQGQSGYFDMRYKTTKDFFNDPVNSKSIPQIKRKQIKELDERMNLLNKNIDRISGYNQRVSSIKNSALIKQLRSNI